MEILKKGVEVLKEVEKSKAYFNRELGSVRNPSFIKMVSGFKEKLNVEYGIDYLSLVTFSKDYGLHYLDNERWFEKYWGLNIWSKGKDVPISSLCNKKGGDASLLSFSTVDTTEVLTARMEVLGRKKGFSMAFYDKNTGLWRYISVTFSNDVDFSSIKRSTMREMINSLLEASAATFPYLASFQETGSLSNTEEFKKKLMDPNFKFEWNENKKTKNINQIDNIPTSVVA